MAGQDNGIVILAVLRLQHAKGIAADLLGKEHIKPGLVEKAAHHQPKDRNETQRSQGVPQLIKAAGQGDNGADAQDHAGPTGIGQTADTGTG